MEISQPAARYTVARRLSKELAEDGFTAVPSTFLEHYHALGLTSSEAMFVIHLLSHKWTEKHPHPTFARIANRMGMTETAVRNHARSLQKKQLVNRITRAGKSNEFDLNPLLKKLETFCGERQSTRQKNRSPQNS